MGTAVHGDSAGNARYRRLAGLALQRYERRYRKTQGAGQATPRAEQSRAAGSNPVAQR